MCILFIYVNPDPVPGSYRLILASNRDEQYKRPAIKAHIDKETNIIGGKDNEPGREGGTWLGFKTKQLEKGKGKKHCVGVILNVTGATIENPLGRGKIITNYLNSNKSFKEYSEILDESKFNGYHFVSVEICKDSATTFHHSNMPNTNSNFTGLHTLGFGNTPIFNPARKVVEGRRRFDDILKQNFVGDKLEEALLDLLKDKQKHLPDEELQRRQPVMYEALSSIFIEINPPGYGTRTHTLIFIDYDWNMRFVEHTMEEPIVVNNPKWIKSVIELRL